MIETIANLFRLTFKLIKWTILLCITGFVILMTVGICLHIEQGKITLPSGDGMENVANEVGKGLAVIGMVVCGVIALWRILKGLCSMNFSSSRSYSAPAPRAAAPQAAPQAARRSTVQRTPAPRRQLKSVPIAKTQHGYKLTYQNITAKKGNTQTVNFLFRGGPTECAMALESGELSGQGFVPSCCQIVSLKMTH